MLCLISFNSKNKSIYKKNNTKNASLLNCIVEGFISETRAIRILTGDGLGVSQVLLY